jgi:hypothetical protein
MSQQQAGLVVVAGLLTTQLVQAEHPVKAMLAGTELAMAMPLVAGVALGLLAVTGHLAIQERVAQEVRHL